VLPREPSGPIQAIPAGLLGFFNLKNVGRNPAVMPDTVQPTLELRDWYFESLAVFDLEPHSITFNPALGVTGFNPYTLATVNMSVPENEFWWVEQLSLRAILGAATDKLSFAPAYRARPLGTQDIVLGQPSEYFVGDGTGGAYAAVTASGFFLPAGAQLGIWIQKIASAGTITVDSTLRYTPLPI